MAAFLQSHYQHFTKWHLSHCKNACLTRWNSAFCIAKQWLLKPKATFVVLHQNYFYKMILGRL